MIPTLLITGLVAFAHVVQGHYTFVRIKADGEWKGPLQYIRNKTSPYDELKYYEANFLYRYYNWPTYIIDRPESVRCGRDNMKHAGTTEVLTLKAGETIEIAHQREEPSGWTDDMFYDCPDDRGTCFHKRGWKQDFNHPGPLLIHLSKAPDGQDIRTYDGSGEWVKIHTLGLTNPQYNQPLNWTLYRDEPEHITFKIPEQTPPGQYLMRMDLLWSGVQSEYIKIGEDGSLAQMYPSCAQLNIVSESKAALPNGVKIPDIFQPLEPGMTTTMDMMENKKLDENYTYPGGPLWDGDKVLVDKPVVLG
ncbi:glycosyl hydrolase family 61-domain-containing protein [Massariosphaeria phaeospora]|uniref:lytic cellulose monooxygenase (C4-dehydrogenating) n=1 Tax=Massariosphaeria phaeospora TaxID=100035 RepID=A0A7C8IIW0_9PLEO|nr:glycosyl hydrolase family 61-domain-containing protein [Massariosphaeria phaeospora]